MLVIDDIGLGIVLLTNSQPFYNKSIHNKKKNEGERSVSANINKTFAKRLVVVP